MDGYSGAESLKRHLYLLGSTLRCIMCHVLQCELKEQPITRQIFNNRMPLRRLCALTGRSAPI